MDRRHILIRMPLLGAAMALPIAARALASDGWAAFPLTSALAAAIASETATYRAEPDGLAEEEANTVTGRVSDLVRALTALPVSTDRDYQLAVALSIKWHLVSEGSYYSTHIDERLACRMADTVLTSSPFDDDHLPMLWHIAGEPCPERPSAAGLMTASVEAQ